MRYTEKILGSIGTIPWGCIEGYNSLVQLALQFLNEIDIIKYTNITENAAIALLANEQLLNSMIHIIFTKTKYECVLQSLVHMKLISWT